MILSRKEFFLSGLAALGVEGLARDSAAQPARSSAPAGAAAPPGRLYDVSRFELPARGTASSGVVVAPTFLQPASVFDLIGLNFAAERGRGALPARMGSFAVYLSPGQLPAGSGIEVIHGRATTPAQGDVLRTHADGSTAHLLVTTLFPALGDGQSAPAMLRRGAAFIAADMVLASVAFSTFSASVTIDGQTMDVSPAALIAAGRPSYWQRGPLATQARFERWLNNAVRVKADLVAYQDGTVEAEYELMADGQFRDAGRRNAWTVSALIRQGGTPVWNVSNLRLDHANGIGKRVSTALSAAFNARNDPPEHNVQIDPARLILAGALPSYDLTIGVNESTLAGYGSILNRPTFRGPGDVAGLKSPGMGEAGGREDIGMLPGWHANYFTTQDGRARRVMIAQAEAYRAMPINHFDGVKGVPVNLRDRPGIWMDPRGSNPAHTIFGASPRDWDGAHQPMLAYGAYLITGRRTFWDALQAQACFTMIFTYAENRRKSIGSDRKDWCIMQNNQPREAGWAMRDVAMASFLAPDAAPLKAHLFEVVDWNFRYLNSRAPAWKMRQGEPHGWLPECSPYGTTDLKPWQQDHVMAGAYWAWMAGSLEAQKFVAEFARNWIVGRGSQPDGVFPYRLGSSYVFTVSNVHDIMRTGVQQNTWAKLRMATGDNPQQWNTGGDYTILWCRSLALVGMMLGDAQALAVLHRILSTGGAYTDAASQRRTNIDAIRPLVWRR